jgi:hypothetical protein
VSPVPIVVLFFPSFEYYYVLKIEATDSPITLVTKYHIAQRHTPEDNTSDFHYDES